MSDDTTPPQDPHEGATPPPPPPPPPPGGEVPPSPYGGTGASMPPPPPPPAYGAPPAGGGAYSPVTAIRYGWDKFIKSPATLLVPVLVMLVAIGIVYVLMFFVVLGSAFSGNGTTINPDGTITYDTGPGFVLRMILMGLVFLVVMFTLQILMAALLKGGLDVVDGRSPSLGELFQGWDKGQVVVTALLVALGTGIGSILCYVPGLIFWFLTSFAIVYVVDKGMGAVDAIKASIAFTTSHLGETILFFLLYLVVTAIGGVLCGIGLLVAYPVVLVAQAYTFRVLNDEPVSPAV